MTKKVFGFLLLLVSLSSIPFISRPAHATIVGTVCIDAAASTSCPVSAPAFTGPVGTKMTVSVNIQGSDSLNGWDISVKTDPGILYPSSDNLASTVFPPGTTIFVLANCINGTGQGCSSTDGPGIVHVALVASVFVAMAPVTGRLFTITYSIVGSTSGTTIGYQTGCTGTSNDSFCVTVANPASPTPVPENLQTASFVNSSTFSISASPTSITLTQGASGTSTITLKSLGGFSGTVTLSAAVSPSVKQAPTASLGTSVILLTSGGTATTTLTVNSKGSTPPGSYTLVLTSTSGSQAGALTISVTIASKK